MTGRVLRRILDITAALLCLSPVSAAQELPVGAEIHVRLTTKVAKKRMSARDFVHGYRPKPGEKLGAS